MNADGPSEPVSSAQQLREAIAARKAAAQASTETETQEQMKALSQALEASSSSVVTHFKTQLSDELSTTARVIAGDLTRIQTTALREEQTKIAQARHQAKRWQILGLAGAGILIVIGGIAGMWLKLTLEAPIPANTVPVTTVIKDGITTTTINEPGWKMCKNQPCKKG